MNDESPFHAGERAAQQEAGVRIRAEQTGQLMIRDAMSEQQRAYFATLPFVLVGSLDDDQRVWASLLTGEPGFLSAPAVVGALALPVGGHTPLLRRVAGLVSSACVIGAASWLMRLAMPFVHHVRASSTPWFVLEKLAVIALLLALLALLTHRLRALPNVLTILGSETLVLFVFHLQIIYGGHWALAHRFGRTLSWPDAILVALFNIALSIVFGLAYNIGKRRLLRPREWLVAPRALAAPSRTS